MNTDYPIEPLPAGWETRTVWFRRTNETEDHRIEIIDTATQLRYYHEPLQLTAHKCMGIFLAGQFYGMVYSLWHLARAPLVALTVAVRGIWEGISHPSWGETVRTFGAVMIGAPIAALENIVAALRAPFYAIAMEAAALYGFFSPLEGKKWLGKIQTIFHHRNVRDDIRSSKDSWIKLIWRGLTDPDNRRTAFFAVCMIPYGRVDDPHIIRTETLFPRLAGPSLAF